MANKPISLTDTNHSAAGAFGSTVTKIRFQRNAISNVLKVYPTKNEIAKGYFTIPDKNQPKEIINGKQTYEMVPYVGADGQPVKVEKSANGNGYQPLTITLSSINPDINKRTQVEKSFMGRGMVDVSLPNSDPNSMLRRRSFSIPAYLVKPEGGLLTAELRDNVYAARPESATRGAKEEGIQVNVPHDPYIVSKNGTKVAVQPETRDYQNKAGVVSKKLMAPAGYNVVDGKPAFVWNDGSKAVVPASATDKIRALQEKGTAYETFEHGIKYETSTTHMKLKDVQALLESTIGAKGPQAPEATQDIEAQDSYDGVEF